jgi:hypothetical protein
MVLVGWAAVGLGVLISAVSGRSRPLANFLLPLLMMMQIVFSVVVAGDGDAFLENAYCNFQWGPPIDTHMDRNQPNVWAARASYITLSRYGDISLRSFAYFSRPETSCAFWEAVATLLAMMFALPALAAAVLCLQENWWTLQVNLALAAGNLKKLLNLR